jgi:hypothetical protein
MASLLIVGGGLFLCYKDGKCDVPAFNTPCAAIRFVKKSYLRMPYRGRRILKQYIIAGRTGLNHA